MTTDYEKLTKQIEELQQQAIEAKNKEVQGALETIHKLIETYGLTPHDLFPNMKRGMRKGTVVPPKYRDPVTGATWTGRGRAPKWLEDKKKEDFLI